MLFLVAVRLLDPIDGDDFAHGEAVDAETYAEAEMTVARTIGPDWETFSDPSDPAGHGV